MPKFIGHPPPSDAIPFTGPRFQATWSQVALARRHGDLRLMRELVRTDKGGPRSFAKRWYAWFLPVEVAAQPWATAAMKARVPRPDAVT